MRSAALFAALPLVLGAPSERVSPAPLLKTRNADVVEGRYIVKTKSGTDVETLEAYKSMVAGKVDYTYNSNKFFGFAASMTPEEVETLQNMSDVSRSQTNHWARVTTGANKSVQGRVH